MQSSYSKLLPLDQVQERIPYSRTQIWRLEKQGRFPRRLRIGPNRVGWLESEIEDWIRSRLDDRAASDNEA